MNTTRTGKIARLPRPIRDELNRRLENGEQAKPLAAWLNSLPEVQAILAAAFDAKPIRPQNLSEWRQGGYRDWLLRQEALQATRHLLEEVAELQTHLPAARSPSPPLEERVGERRPATPTNPPVHQSINPSSTLQPPSSSCLSDMVSLWVTARYAVASRSLATTDGPAHWRLLRELCTDIVELRRGDHAAERLRLDRLRLAHQLHDRQLQPQPESPA